MQPCSTWLARARPSLPGRHGYVIYKHKEFTLGRICHHPGNPTLTANKQHLEDGNSMPWVDMFEMKPEEGKDSYTIDSVRTRPGG